MRTLLLPLIFLCAGAACAADVPIKVDGHIDPDEWAGATHITDFRLTQPLSRAPSPYPTEAWIKATPEGLAVAFHSTQPANVPRTHQSAPRDAGGPYDRVNLYVDFDGDGHVGYNFMVMLSDSIQDETITNENQFNTDWDGNWKHAVSEDAEGWSVEMLIPWYIAPMKKGHDGKRTLGIQLDRVIGSTGERVGWPAIFGGEQRFLSAFSKVEVPEYHQSLIAVTPFVSAVYDNITHKAHLDTGTDIFWKPSGSFQLSGTLNPDFGQVESDDLVVNFSAVETFFSDKRPFFTENQNFFDVPFGAYGNNDRLIYTRRVGGPTDDGSGLAGDVTAAVKANGSLGAFNYGVFAASEADAVGRDFEAARVTRDFDTQGFGAMVTNVDHPFLDRTATVYEFDHRWKPDPQWNVRTVVVGSAIDQAGVHSDDTGMQTQVDYDMGKGWRQQLYAEHLGRNLQLDDFGFLDRNNFNYARYDLGKRFTDLPKTSIYADQDWHVAVSDRVDDQGVHLADAWSFSRTSDMRNGGTEYLEFDEFSPGVDDLVTRGNGNVKVPGKLYGYWERNWPRGQGHWAFYGNVRYAAEGLRGPRYGSVQLDLNPTYFVNDRLSFYSELIVTHNPDLVVWQQDNLLGSFRASQLNLNAGMQWEIDSKQELRIKLETIALDARLLQAWRVAADGTPVASNDPVPDFNLRNLGFQIRYKYELAPLSDLYIAYVRGGFDFEDVAQPVTGLLGNAFSLKDSEQFLVKVAYRFEL
ncbi:MAG TPA: DUF5916 domain-containing protein [Xanthomonadaceae bacterium]|jgi:hypothetical protein